MNNITVKICGLKTENDIKICMDHGINILGFVTEYPIPVPWNLNRIEAGKLFSSVNSGFKTCIVTGGTVEKIIELANVLRPSMVQLHFKETLEDTKKIASTLKKINIETIKTMPTTYEACIHQFGTTDIKYIVNSLCETEIFGILVDSRTPYNLTKASSKIKPDFFTQIKLLSSKPVILAGGITPTNVNEIVEQTNTEYIDVMTGVEKEPGIKDELKIINIINNLNFTTVEKGVGKEVK